MSNKFTVTYELKNKDSDIHKKIMENFADSINGKKSADIEVFAITRGDLHKQIEDIEDCLDNSPQEDLAYDISETLSKRY